MNTHTTTDEREKETGRDRKETTIILYTIYTFIYTKCIKFCMAFVHKHKNSNGKLNNLNIANYKLITECTINAWCFYRYLSNQPSNFFFLFDLHSILFSFAIPIDCFTNSLTLKIFAIFCAHFFFNSLLRSNRNQLIFCHTFRFTLLRWLINDISSTIRWTCFDNNFVHHRNFIPNFWVKKKHRNQLISISFEICVVFLAN